VLRQIAAETTLRLLQLALTARAVPTCGVVPCDRHVNEPLEEVPLGCRRGEPFLLELLVRLEVFAIANQLQSAFERHEARLSASANAANVET